MKTYARVQDGVFAELIEPVVYDTEEAEWTAGDPSRVGSEVPIEQRFTAELVATMHDITGLEPMPQPDWRYNGSVFSPPTPPIIDLVAVNEAHLQSLLDDASRAMAPILVSLQLGDATDDETVAARAWQAYYRELKVVDVTVPEPDWPVAPA